MTGETMEVTIYGKTYSIIAVDNEDGTFSPSICEVAADGGCGRMIVDSETTDEAYETSRECLQRAMAHVI